MRPPSWKILAAGCDSQSGEKAATVASIEVVSSPGMVPVEFNGPVTLQQFSDAALFRIVVHYNNSARNTCVLCLPPDTRWVVEPVRKIKGKRSGKKALELELTFPPENVEGFSKLKITMPYDGDTGNAMLFCEAVHFAAQSVQAAVDRALAGSN